MKTYKHISALGLASLITATSMVGCSSQPSQPSDANRVELKKLPYEPTMESAKPAQVTAAPAPEKRKNKPHLIKITGVGYGSESTYEGYTPGQRRLMAIRASKLDAYRSLAEQLYGIKIDSNTAISTLTAQTDSFRARVNSVVRGARVVSITPMADHNYETVLEVYVDRDFFNNAFVYTQKNAEAEKAVMSIGDICANGGCR